MNKNAKSIKAVIYDLDGVLVDTRKYHFKALNKALARHGYNITSYEHSLKYEGLPTTSKLEILTKEKGLPTKLYQQIIKDKYQEIAKSINTFFKPDIIKTKLLKGIMDMGIKQVLCTNTTKSTTEKILEIMKIKKYFTFYLTRADINKPKPNAEIYNKAIEQLKLKAADCLIIEDSEHGLKAAKATGAHIIKAVNIDQINYEYIASKIRKINICEK